MPYHPSVLSSRTQLWRAFGVGARALLAWEFTGRELVFQCLLARYRRAWMRNALVDPPGAFPIECSEHNAVSMPSVCVSEACTQSWEPVFYFLCTRKQEKQDDSSLPHCVCAQSLTAHVVGKNCDYACAVVRQHACNHLSAGMDAVKDHKANTSLTEVYLSNNNVGDAGAAALADALQATVLACGSNSFQACASCFRRCRFATWFQQLASPSY